MKKRSVLFLFLAMSSNAFSLEVIKPVFKEKIILRIVRAIPDSFETYSLTNHNGREMTLVCAKNRVYDNNPEALIEYRNYFNEIAGKFKIDSNVVCQEMGKFIEAAHHGIDQQKPFIITLNTKTMNVEKIVYPKIDAMSDTGDIKDLLPKKEIRDFVSPQIYLER